MVALTLSQAGAQRRCSKAPLSHLINGKLPKLPPLPVLRIGRRVLIRLDALERWLLSLECRGRDGGERSRADAMIAADLNSIVIGGEERSQKRRFEAEPLSPVVMEPLAG